MVPRNCPGIAGFEGLPTVAPSFAIIRRGVVSRIPASDNKCYCIDSKPANHAAGEARFMTDERKAPYPTEPTDYTGGPVVTDTSSSDTVRINVSVEMKLDPEKLRCLQDSGITITSNVVT